MKYIIYNLYLSYHFYYANITLVLRFLNCVVSVKTFQRAPSFSIFRSPFFFVVFHFFPQFSSFPVILVFRFPSVFFSRFFKRLKKKSFDDNPPPSTRARAFNWPRVQAFAQSLSCGAIFKSVARTTRWRLYSSK